MLVCYFYKNPIRILAPAPSGVHGEYSLNSAKIYQTNKSRDSVLFIFKKNGLVIKTGRLNYYDAPWDSLRYRIEKFSCGDDLIEAYIEFEKKKNSGSSFKVLWFNGPPTEDENNYSQRTQKYYKCFENFLQLNGIVK